MRLDDAALIALRTIDVERPGAGKYHGPVRARLLVAILVLSACGGGGPRLRSSARAAAAELEGAEYLIEASAARVPLLRRDERSIEELDAARDAARGVGRRTALLDLARAHMLEAAESDDRERRRHRASAERFADAAANGSRDDWVQAQAAFVELWLAYRAGDRSASSRAERFTTRHAQSGELALLGWVVRGEIAFAAEDWDGAIASYRYVLGELGHPLYAYALYRTAQAHSRDGDAEGSRQALGEVARLGCDRDVPEPTLRIALHAARESGDGIRRASDGREVPAICPEASAGGEDEEERGAGGWRPDE